MGALTGLSAFSAMPAIFGASGTYSDKVLGYGPTAYWPLWEAGGGVAECLVNPAQNGAYIGVTLGQPGIGDGNTCPLFDGANDYVNIYSTALSAAFGYNEGAVAIWWKAFNAAVWTDDAYRFAVRLTNSTYPEEASIYKLSTNAWNWRYSTQGVQKQVELVTTPVTWQHAAVTWSLSNNEMIAYIAGIQSGVPQANNHAWQWQTLTNIQTLIGAYSTVPGFPWYGWLAHCVVFDTAQSPAVILDLATV